MMENILSRLRFALAAGTVLLAMLTIAGCTLNNLPTPTIPAITSTPIFPTSPQTSTPATTLALSSYTINIASRAIIGDYLVDGSGMTLYYTMSDRSSYSNLPDETLSSWPAFYVSNILVPPSLNASDFGTYTRDHNIKQTTYKGYPLYYFFQDKTQGDTLGNKLGGVWFIVNPGDFQP